jgi:hypothetical protein
MRVFVGQKIAASNSCSPVREVVGACAVLAGLVVFQAFAANRITERKEEIVMIVVMGVEKLLRLDYQVLVVLQFFRRDLQLLGLVSEISR